jgi:hypothetical protein
VQLLDLPKLYFPATHMSLVGEVEPAGQAYPAVQAPVQLLEVIAAVLPYSPAGQLVQAEDPATL